MYGGHHGYSWVTSHKPYTPFEEDENTPSKRPRYAFGSSRMHTTPSSTGGRGAGDPQKTLKKSQALTNLRSTPQWPTYGAAAPLLRNSQFQVTVSPPLAQGTRGVLGRGLIGHSAASLDAVCPPAGRREVASPHSGGQVAQHLQEPLPSTSMVTSSRPQTMAEASAAQTTHRQLGFGGSLHSTGSGAQQAWQDRAAYAEFFRRVRPDAAPQVLPSASMVGVPALATASEASAVDVSGLIAEVTSPSARTRALDMKRREAADTASEVHFGAKSRHVDARLSNALSGFSSKHDAAAIHAVEQHLQRLNVSRPMELPPAVDSGLTPLTEEQETMVREAMAAGRATDVLSADCFTGFGDLEITRKKMDCMRDGQWLNDEVINFYLALLLRRQLAKDGGEPRVHFHSTFFYNKLYRDAHEYNYKNVSRWTTEKKLGYQIMKCHTIIVPVHQEMHWVLAVIDMKKREVKYLDSLKGVDRMCLQNLVRYACDEAQAKLNETWSPSDWTVSAPKDIPEQHNGCDCGVFMLKYADWLARDAPLSFSQEQMPYFRRRLVADIIARKA